MSLLGIIGDIGATIAGAAGGILLAPELGVGAGVAGLVGAGIGSQVGTNIANSSNVADTNQAQLQAVQQQEAFQQYNSNTAYQRAMQDMNAAGLNPMLAFSQGGASTPQGAMPNTQTAKLDPINGSGAVQSVLAMMDLDRQIKETDSKISTNDESQALMRAQAKAAQSSALNQQAQADYTTTQNELEKPGIPAAKLHGKFDENMSTFDATMNRINPFHSSAQSYLKLLK